MGVAAAFENIGKSDQVGIDIGRGIDRRMRDAGLRRKVRDISEALLGEQCLPRRRGRQHRISRNGNSRLSQVRRDGPFQSRIVIVVEIVDSMDGPAVGEKPARQMKADEPGSAGDKNGLAHGSVLAQIRNARDALESCRGRSGAATASARSDRRLDDKSRAVELSGRLPLLRVVRLKQSAAGSRAAAARRKIMGPVADDPRAAADRASCGCAASRIMPGLGLRQGWLATRNGARPSA